MLAFFYSLYMALFTGQWGLATYQQMQFDAQKLWQDFYNLVSNALGGNFSTLQDFIWKCNPTEAVCVVLAYVTLIGVCIGVWKLVKAVFSIFFRGV